MSGAKAFDRERLKRAETKAKSGMVFSKLLSL
jgi:hypothetical protein